MCLPASIPPIPVLPPPPPAPSDNNTNTGKSTNADKDVLDSNSKPDQGRVTEVLTFDPVGHLKSSFGHTAININGITYAFTEKGWNKEEKTANYLTNNDFRDAVGQELNLTAKEQDLLVKMIKQDMAEKPKWSSQNSCVTKIRDVPGTSNRSNVWDSASTADYLAIGFSRQPGQVRVRYQKEPLSTQSFQRRKLV